MIHKIPLRSSASMVRADQRPSYLIVSAVNNTANIAVHTLPVASERNKVAQTSITIIGPARSEPRP